MRYTISFLFLIFLPFSVIGQNISALALLEKSINYHDPKSNWNTFNGNFKVTTRTQDQNPRESDITINLPARFFNVTAVKDTVITTYTIGKEGCALAYNSIQLDTVAAKEKGLTCERARMYKNYYTYLYGLPMKLKDNGTNLDPTVEKKTFKGKDYLVLKITYDAEVGSDIWNFYFDPKTYAMKIYEFFKTDKKGNVDTKSGEYILLSEEVLINGIKMPKIRAWFYNKDGTYLGTDIMSK
jgi:hypothetical protein